MIWSGLGMNYGHQAVYDTAQIESDFTFLKSQGITRLRIAGPTFGGGGSTANCQDMVTRALNHGFYVVWGVATGKGHLQLDATTWASFKSYVTGALATWIQTSGLSEFMIGNECDWEADGTTLLQSTVRSDVRAMASTVKSGGYTGGVSYNTSVGVGFTNWNSEGLGSLDRIGWNSYDSLTNFTTTANAIAADFGTRGYISEFSCFQLGFGDYNDENAYATDVLARINILQTAGIGLGYFFCYRDGAFGLTPNTYALVQTNNVARCARGTILNTPGQKIFSSFAM